MTPYLKQVASHWAGAQDLGSTMFIFPNRRSLVFFKHYLKEQAALGGSPFLAPPMLTINDFFCHATGRSASDRITLLVRLYDCYKQLNPKAESLDDFIGWGDVLLADFDDVDKYLVDARGLFANIRDLSSIESDYSWLDDRQKEAIKRLAGYALDHKPKQEGKLDVKGSFFSLWSLLYPLYSSFREQLEANNEAYEGQIYRALADRLESESVSDVLRAAFPQVDSFVFVGLNALSESESKVLRKMHTAGIAQFSWDYTGPMITAKGNGSTHFMERNLADFPGSFVPALEGPCKPAVNVCGIPSATGQARLLPELISCVPPEQRGLDFAVVLGDETMLMSVLNSLPSCPDGVNVTMGHPLASSEFASLMNDVMDLQLHIRHKQDGWWFYHKQVHDIFSSGLLKKLLGPEDLRCIDDVNAAAKYYIPQSDFAGAPLLGIIFRPADELYGYLLELVDVIAPMLDELQREFALSWHHIAVRLKDENLPVLPRTKVRLLQQLIAGASVPFEGEPLGGLQVMGPLETRALDFRNLVIMGANESVFPRSSIAPSFVPPEIRKAFGLPTYEYQEDVWAYYFYRMITRAENVWMLYDSRTEGLNTGEESRYVKQLRYLYGEHCELKVYSAQADVQKGEELGFVPKTEEAIEKIKDHYLSASSVQKYIKCPVAFYYSVVEGLELPSEINESLDAGMIGNVLHKTMQKLYSPVVGQKDAVNTAYLDSWLKRQKDIHTIVLQFISAELKTPEVSGRDLVTADIIVTMVKKILSRDRELVRRRGPITIIGLELKKTLEIGELKFIGFIDRVDSFPDGCVRVVDYKTGKDDPEVLKDTFVASKVFEGGSIDKCKAALQFYIYDRMLDDEYGLVCNSMYAMSSIFKDAVEVYPQSPANNEAFGTGLEEVLEQMLDPLVPFERTTTREHCKYCDFKILCGRMVK